MDETGSVYGWLSVLPPIITILLAVVTRRVLTSLLIGIAAGVAILQPSIGLWRESLAPSAGQDVGSYALSTTQSWFQDFFVNFLWAQISDLDHLLVILFTTILSMQIALIHRSGGMQGILALMAPLAKTRRGGQFLTWCMGMIIFIDDYANTLLLGSAMRPVTDRLKVSRAKLAYLVDSTAAPVAGLAVVSTWVAVEISYIQDGYAAGQIDLGTQGFSVFLATIPVRFYVIFALVTAAVVALSQRDFGPMLTSERKALSAGPDDQVAVNDEPVGRPRWYFAVLPIFVTVAIACYYLYQSGLTTLSNDQVELPSNTLHRWALIIGNGNSYWALMYGSSAGLLLILAMTLYTQELKEDEIVLSLYAGAKHVLPAIMILWFAWTLSALTKSEYLGSGDYLASILQEKIPLWAYPTVTFLLAGLVAFATGTSWGTMATLFPLVIPLLIKVLPPGSDGSLDNFDPILISTIGSVLAGAIWGDHCSPISDTTVLSSKASSCDHIEHVRTQMPYAILGGLVSIIFGTIPSAFGVSSWILIPAGSAAIVFCFYVFGKKADS